MKTISGLGLYGETGDDMWLNAVILGMTYSIDIVTGASI